MSEQGMCIPVLLLIGQSSVSEVIPLGQEQSDYKYALNNTWYTKTLHNLPKTIYFYEQIL